MRERREGGGGRWALGCIIKQPQVGLHLGLKWETVSLSLPRSSQKGCIASGSAKRRSVGIFGERGAHLDCGYWQSRAWMEQGGYCIYLEVFSLLAMRLRLWAVAQVSSHTALPWQGAALLQVVCGLLGCFIHAYPGSARLEPPELASVGPPPPRRGMVPHGAHQQSTPQRVRRIAIVLDNTVTRV